MEVMCTGLLQLGTAGECSDTTAKTLYGGILSRLEEFGVRCAKLKVVGWSRSCFFVSSFHRSLFRCDLLVLVLCSVPAERGASSFSCFKVRVVHLQSVRCGSFPATKAGRRLHVVVTITRFVASFSA